jgi:hypothetical protein
MALTYFLLIFTLSALGQGQMRIEVLPNPTSLEDFDHQFKGCPENSQCDQVMGHMLLRWKNYLQDLKSSGDRKKNALKLENYRKKYGLTFEFYTTEKSSQQIKGTLAPVIHSSSCREHNPKKGEKILRAMVFAKSLSSSELLVWRDHGEIKFPLAPHIRAQVVRVYEGASFHQYLLSLGDQPLFMKDGDLYVLKEDQDFYYMLKISRQGQWSVVDVDFSKLSEWESKRQDVECPKEAEGADPIFTHSFCKKLWDEREKKLLVVKMQLGCAI